MNKTSLRSHMLYWAWLTALISTLFALYLGEIQHWPICQLCWYQRTCLFPLTIILGIAAYHDDHNITLYAMPLACLSLIFASYQYIEQHFSSLANIGFCAQGPSCQAIHFKLLGFITLPLLSAIGSSLILILLFLNRKTSRRPKVEQL